MCIVLVDCRRSVVRWQPERRATQLDRLRRVGRDAAMQSRRVWLPTIDGPVPLGDVVAAGGAVLADPDGDPLTTATTVVIGPEGGFTAEELELAPAVSLGEPILRVETAALVAAILTRSV